MKISSIHIKCPNYHVKYTKNPHDLLKFVPSLKISIQTAEINSKKKMNSVKQLELLPSRKQLELFPDDVGSIDN